MPQLLSPQRLEHRVPRIRIEPGLEFREHYFPKTLQAAIKKAARRSGVDKPANCHMLRHSFAVHCLEKGDDVRKVQSLLGHGDLRTTRQYNQIIENNRRANPPKREVFYEQRQTA